MAKCLEKDRGVLRDGGGAGEDIRRHLSNSRSVPRPASTIYRVAKFVRRNKALVGGVAGIFFALVAGLVGTLNFAAGEAQQRGRAEQNARGGGREAGGPVPGLPARLAAATAALQNHDVADAARQLDAAPEDLRGWEWRHLHSRLDDSSAVIPLPAGGAASCSPARTGSGSGS